MVLAGLAVPFLRSSQQEVDIHAPYVTTPLPVVDAMLKLARTRQNDVVYDLGCGDGRIVIAAAKQYGARGVGIDIDPERVREARANAKREGVESLVRFTAQNVYEIDFREATVVTMYLLPDMHRKLSPKLRKDLKPGARIVTHTFDLGEWKPHQTQSINGEQIFLWRVNRKV
jgi:cyclopropane fatty-acyl-phospholipid synthase-like methyltransferase